MESIRSGRKSTRSLVVSSSSCVGTRHRKATGPTTSFLWKLVVLCRAGARRSRSRLDDLVANRVTHEIADRIQAQLAHDVGAVRFDGLHADAQARRGFLVASAFREQLDDFTFAR